jgi:hypothetical protein
MKAKTSEQSAALGPSLMTWSDFPRGRASTDDVGPEAGCCQERAGCTVDPNQLALLDGEPCIAFLEKDIVSTYA